MSVISIDLWGTLIKSSPSFTDAKVALVEDYFPECKKAYILNAFECVKHHFNEIIESIGWQPTQLQLFTYLFRQFDPNLDIFSKHDSKIKIAFFAKEYQELALQYHPVIFSDETIDFLEKLAINNELKISSNTLLIDGDTLFAVLKKLKISKYFNDMLFSDKTKVSKPNPLMFGSKYHIGDNPFTDEYGAKISSSIPIIINSTNLTIKDAYNIITSQSGQL
jgi:FMN phosphatase YigB (HAD superfamily)